MRALILLFLAACGPKPTAVQAVPEPTSELAPRLFDAAALRDAFVLGTKLRLRIESAGEPAVEERWEVVGHTPEGCTIRATVHDPATGELLEDQGEGTSTWAELESHASFPADRTRIVDTTITVPAGTFETRRYTVSSEDGTIQVLHFAKTLPGPPVSMEVTKDGALVTTMVLLERTP